MRLRIIAKQYMVMISVGLFFLFSSAFFVWQNFQIEKVYTTASTNALAQINQSSTLSSTAQLIRYYDEILTQSARNYAFTGDTKWRQRYNDFVTKLDEQIKYAENNDPQFRGFFSEVDTANQKLVTMEENSASLVKQEKNADALQILDSTDYATQKQIYANALEKYIAATGSEFNQTSSSSNNQLQIISQTITNDVRQTMYIALIILLVFAGLMTVIGFAVTKFITRPIEKLSQAAISVTKGELDTQVNITNNDEIGDLAKNFNKMTKTIKESQKNTETKIKERTEDLEKLNKFMTGREIKMIELKDKIKELEGDHENQK